VEVAENRGRPASATSFIVLLPFGVAGGALLVLGVALEWAWERAVGGDTTRVLLVFH